MDRNLVIKNRDKLLSQMKDNSLLVLFAGKAPHRSADQAYQFTPNRNFYYVTGIKREEFILLIRKYKGKTNTQLFITKPNPDIEKWTGIRMRVEEAKEVSGIQNISFIESFPTLFEQITGSGYFENIYLDTEYHENTFLNGLSFSEHINKHYPHFKISNANYIIHDLRTIKEKEEIQYIKKAIEITKHGIEAIMKNSRSGIYEKQLEAYFDFEIKYHMADSCSFKTIMANGKNATILHYEENDHILEDGNLVLFDLGAEFEHYCSDITRTIPVNGKFTPRQKEVYESVLRVNEAIIKIIKPGLIYKDFLDTAKNMLAEECIKLGLIKDKKDVGKYYYHGVGHFLGLDVHDVGRRDFLERKFEPGMVLTVEPGLYIAEEGIGIRIEDDVLVTEDGYENLSKDIIKSVEDIERLMNS
ncbi:aminopeptidase P family protein [Mycoplasmatota bacterium]|nr:aminopeptidase P family protein [Mycoplasmatota bacterium]